MAEIMGARDNFQEERTNQVKNKNVKNPRYALNDLRCPGMVITEARARKLVVAQRSTERSILGIG